MTPMELKITNFDDRYLKEYLITVAGGRVMSRTKEELALNKLLNAAEKHEKDEAEMALIENNLKAVIAAGCRYRGAGISFARIIKAGNEGLIKAVKNWKGKEDFHRYTAWRIEGGIIDKLIKSRRGEVQKKR